MWTNHRRKALKSSVQCAMRNVKAQGHQKLNAQWWTNLWTDLWTELFSLADRDTVECCTKGHIGYDGPSL